jgi:hypothetical protein
MAPDQFGATVIIHKQVTQILKDRPEAIVDLAQD